MKVNIIGSGIGGMSCAAILAKNNFEVTVLEQTDGFGGKAGLIKKNGFKFDTGPCLMTYPEWFDELFKLCDFNPRSYYNYQKLKVVTRYFVDGKSVDVEGDLSSTAQNFENNLGVDANFFTKYMTRWDNIYKISEKIFLLRDLRFDSIFFKETIRWFIQNGFSNIYKSMANYNSTLNNKPLEKIMNRFATYTGSSPYASPAFMNQLAVVEMINGAYYPKGGIYTLPRAINRLCLDLGVEFVYNKQIKRIENVHNKFKISCDNDTFTSDKLISNIDYHKTQLLLNRKVKVKNSQLSTSGIVFYWGVKISSKNLALHNVIFSDNYKKEFDDIFMKKMIPEDPTIFINITSKMDKHHAPDEYENWFVMVNTPPSFHIINKANLNKLKNIIVKKIEKTIGIDISELIHFEEILNPKTLSIKTGSLLGSIYGENQNSLKAIIKRKDNKDKTLKNLYYVGGTVHPGGGMPLALRSGINVAQKIIN